MPLMQTALSQMNSAFSAEGLGAPDDDLIEEFRPGPETSLTSALSRMPNMDLSEAVLEFVATWPSGLQRAVQALIWENFRREATVPITFAWTPSYDYSITAYDVLDTNESTGGITLLFTSRYPADAHPLHAASGN